MAKSGLGKGFDSLIPKEFNRDILVDSKERVQKLLISEVVPNPSQPRKHFDETALEELALSIKRFGVLQPLIVSPSNKKNGYILVAGERRWRASKIAGLTYVPAIVRHQKEIEQLEIALIENVQRVDLSPLEQAVSIEKLHNQFNLSYKEIADRLGKAVSTVNNIVRLLQLPPDAIDALQKNLISEGHGRAVLSLKDMPQQQKSLLNAIIKKQWSVRQAEQYATTCKQGSTDDRIVKKRMAATTPQTKRLSQKLSVPVTVRRTAKGGRLELHFKSDDELEGLINRIGTA
jgi:ParB family transcriptional regulator, chromosome partitioning protein